MADTASPPNNSLQQQSSVTEANDVLQKSLHIGGKLSDPADRFRGKGTTFKAKLIGVEDVPESRGDQMCQEAILKLQAIVKASGEHKTKIIINVSLEGLKIIELLTGTILHTHPVHLISFIARDLTDRRAFGYIFGVEEGKHQFFGIKTQKAAELLVLALRDLFQVVYEMKKKEMESAKTQQAQQPQSQPEEVYAVPNNRPVAQQTPTRQQHPQPQTGTRQHAPDVRT
uniref:PID domain-containing protein n=1 Tax=Ciona savignyi TaxID=51511 RepID=H2Y9P8_CIOSA